jgi:MarC family membrane protein
MPCRAKASGWTGSAAQCSTGGGAAIGAHSGQSKVLPDTSEALPSAAVTSIFIAPEPVQTSKISRGWTMGDATATPSDNTNQASTRRLIKVKWRRVRMARLSSTDLTGPLTWVNFFAMMNYTFLSATILLVLITDPVGNIPIFANALKHVAPERRARVILREILIAFALLLTFMFVGESFLRVMNLSELALQIGGGVILFLIALRMVFPPPVGAADDEQLAEPLIVPLAVPAIAGPSALATVLLLVSQQPERRMEWIGALCVTMLVSAVVLVSAERIQRVIGTRLVTAVERLMGLVLVSVAIEMMLRGFKTFALQLMHG